MEKRVEYQLIEEDTGMTVAWASTLADALHYHMVYNHDSKHELYKITREKIQDSAELAILAWVEENE